jgi:hypothetical protein
MRFGLLWYGRLGAARFGLVWYGSIGYGRPGSDGQVEVRSGKARLGTARQARSGASRLSRFWSGLARQASCVMVALGADGFGTAWQAGHGVER